MSTIHPAWVEHQRRLRPDGQRWVRHDAHRFAPPSVQTKSFAARRIEQRQAEEQATLAAEQSALHDDLVRLRWLVADLKFELAWRQLCRKYGYNPGQPRVPSGNPDGGQWTSGADTPANHDQSLEQDRASHLTTARDQTPRGDLSQLEAIANDPTIRSRINEAWAASNPQGIPREHGFWVSRNDTTGELFTRPFANPGMAGSITPGPPPSDAIASFHTHPLRPDFGGRPEPSRGDLELSTSMGLPGLLQSHNGMYYFGPPLRSRSAR